HPRPQAVAASAAVVLLCRRRAEDRRGERRTVPPGDTQWTQTARPPDAALRTGPRRSAPDRQLPLELPWLQNAPRPRTSTVHLRPASHPRWRDAPVRRTVHVPALPGKPFPVRSVWPGVHTSGHSNRVSRTIAAVPTRGLRLPTPAAETR